MTYSRDPDALIQAFLDDGISELPDSSYDVVRASIEHTRQRVVFGPWREEQVNRLAILGVAAAAIVLAVVVGIQFLPGAGGVGGPPPATPTPAPTPTPSPTPPPTPAPTPAEDPSGKLQPGTYIAHPFAEPYRAMSFTFEVPSDSWEAVGPEPGRTDGLLKATPHNNGVGLMFLLIDSLNGDPCKWSGTDDDVALGPTVDDLVAALTSSDDYETSEPEGVTLGQYSGKKLVITMPSSLPTEDEPPLDCDEEVYRIWNATDGFDIWAQGPEHLWNTWIMDVEGTRVVIMAVHFDDSDGARVGELQSIVESIVITAP